MNSDQSPKVVDQGSIDNDQTDQDAAAPVHDKTYDVDGNLVSVENVSKSENSVGSTHSRYGEIEADSLQHENSKQHLEINESNPQPIELEEDSKTPVQSMESTSDPKVTYFETQDENNEEKSTSLAPCTNQDQVVETVAAEEAASVVQTPHRSIQICCGCQRERASVICSSCKAGVASGACLAISMDNADEHTSLSIDGGQANADDEKTVPNNRGKINVESLIQSGNLFYCNECFLVVHQKMHGTHMPIDLRVSSKIQISPVVLVASLKEEKIQQQQLHQQNDELPTPPTPTAVEVSQEDEAKATQALADKERRRVDFESAMRQIESLNKRHIEFNGVKQSIKLMNDLIRDDMLLDFAATAEMMKQKLDELTLTVKERLKDAYSVVRDTQDKVKWKIFSTYFIHWKKLFFSLLNLIIDFNLASKSFGQDYKCKQRARANAASRWRSDTYEFYSQV